MTESKGCVLVAVDFSADSEAAVLWASEIADATNRPMKVLHAAHEPAESPGFYRSNPDDLMTPLKEVAGKHLAEFFAKLCEANPGCASLRRAEPLLVEGVPSVRIIEVAEKVGADLIVVGSRGLTGISHIFIGSTALSVAQHAEIPVTVVKAKRQEPDA